MEFRNTGLKLEKRKIIIHAHAYWSSGIQDHGPGIPQEQGSSAPSKKNTFVIECQKIYRKITR